MKKQPPCLNTYNLFVYLGDYRGGAIYTVLYADRDGTGSGCLCNAGAEASYRHSIEEEKG